MNRFKEFPLSKEILQSLDSLGYTTATPVQSSTILPLLKGDNLVVRAITGSGKTGAFGIPIIERIDWIENHPQGLIIAPNRELVIQIAEDIRLMGRYKRIKAIPIYGRDSIKAQTIALKQKNHIVVATPGRLMDLIERQAIKLDKLKYLILDEADELLRAEFMKQLSSTFEMLPKDCSISLFSATITENVERIQEFTTHKFNYCDASVKDKPLINEYFYHVEETEKFTFLQKQIASYQNQGGIIFVSTKSKTEKVYQKLKKNGHSVTLIHSELDQRSRVRNMNGFKDGTFTYLIATDLSARGIDVNGIDLVINYDLPVDLSNYTHRIGRIGRNGNQGTAISLIASEQNSLVPKLERKLGRSFDFGDPDFDLLQDKDCPVNSTPTIPREVKGINSGHDITKLYINGGKRKKLRAGDIVGTICSIPSMTPDDIGVIEIKENETYVEILNHKYQLVIDELRTRNIKGRKYKIHKAK